MGRLIARVRMMPLLSRAKSLLGKGTRPIFAYLLTLEQGFKSPGLGPKILFGRTNLRSELRCGVPGPTRIVDNRTRQGDHVSIAGHCAAISSSGPFLAPQSPAVKIPFQTRRGRGLDSC